MIQVSALTKRYGDVLAVSDVSFHVGEGEVVGFLGPNGAGKSTTLRILTAFIPATRGTVKIAGFDVLRDSLAVRQRIGYLPETVPVYPDMRVEEYLRFRALLKGVARRDLKSRVGSALERCGCAEMRRRMIGTLSKGYRQRVGLADAIVHDPPLLILDEPTSGLDPNQRVEVRELIHSLGRDKTVLLSSHILAEVEAVARRVVIIRRGRVVAEGTFAELLERFRGEARVRVEVAGAAAAVRAVLGALAGFRDLAASTTADGWTAGEATFDGAADRREAVGDALIAAGLRFRELSAPDLSLEQLFRRLTLEEAA